jgi:asparagine synthase (glutamine-hydrolysing)
LSEECLKKTGWFDPQAVTYWRQAYLGLKRGSNQRTSVEMGLVAVLSTQLWHHTFVDGSLADLAPWSSGHSRPHAPREEVASASRGA